jgi:competence protein ComEC
MPRAEVNVVAHGGNPLVRGLLQLKERAKAILSRSVPEPESALLTGILLGYERGIPKTVRDAFARTNTSHIVAISGFNIAVLTALLYAALGRLLGRYRATPLIIAILLAYMLLVGAYAAVVRATLMGILLVMGLHLGRPSNVLNALGLAAMAMTVISPWALWDIGFQLSFAATLGLLCSPSRLLWDVDKSLQRHMPAAHARRLAGLVGEAVLTTLAAQIATLPIIVYYFGSISWVGLLANALVLPVQPAVMLMGGATILVGSILPPLGRLLGAAAWLPTAYTIRIVEWLARPQWAVSEAHNVPLLMVAAAYALLGALALRARWLPGARVAGAALAAAVAGQGMLMRGSTSGAGARRPGPLRGWASAVTLPALGVTALMTWQMALSQPNGLTHVTFLDVGQGDAILIQTALGRQVVVDGGPSPAALLDGLGRRIPFWDRSLDLVVLTHGDADHVTGLTAALQRYSVAAILESGVDLESPEYAAWRDAVVGHSGLMRASKGLRVMLGGAVWLETLHPGPLPITGTASDSNNNSLVTILHSGAIDFLLTGDIEEEAETSLARMGGLRSEVMKVAHHGSNTSTTPALLDAVAPWAAVISVGADNRFGHPTQAVLQRLTGIPMYRTDKHGAVEFTTDGRRLWVRTQR